MCRIHNIKSNILFAYLCRVKLTFFFKLYFKNKQSEIFKLLQTCSYADISRIFFFL